MLSIFWFFLLLIVGAFLVDSSEHHEQLGTADTNHRGKDGPSSVLVSRPPFTVRAGPMSNSGFKHVFVCGLHRSGTTPLASAIGKLRECTTLQNTGVIADEGQHLQRVYPPDDAYGGAGKFGFAPQAHLTETSAILSPATVCLLRQSWERYWESDKPVRVEKTPGNLLMTRFLQAAFENTYFIVIKRHPVAVSLATQKWSRTSLCSLFEHWQRCHTIFDEDKKYLKHVYELKYEDYILDPGAHIEQIASFLDTDPSSGSATARHDYNQRYLDRWSEMLQSSPFRTYYRLIASMYEERFAAYGYSLAGPFNGKTFSFGRYATLRRVVRAPLRLAGDLEAISWGALSVLERTARPLCRRLRSTREPM